FLTDTRRLPEWFGDGAIEPRVGGAVTIMGGHVRGVVTQWKPPRRLAYTFNVFDPGGDESRYPESYLTIELEPRGKNVLLTLTHLPVLERFEKQNAMGWHTYLDLLSAAVRGEPPQTREAHMKRNAARYGVDLANLQR
ncbi:MAG TPA: SRPBCC domain-containing protein, partial [Stellaceae bacterium]